MKKTYFVILLILVMVIVTGCSTPTVDSNWKDGTYFATYSHTDSHDWRPFLRIVIEGGEITSGWMDYESPDGTIKSQDEAYGERMFGCTGVRPTEVYTSFEEDFLKHQDIAKVDAVSGASHSSHEVQEMGVAILKQAETGDTTEIVIPMNGTYKASNKEFDDHGWKGEVALTFEGGKLTEVVYDEVNEEDVKKSEDAEYAEKFQSTDGLSPAEVYASLAAQLVESQDVEQVDAVSGATHSGENFVELVKEALAKRVPYEK